MRIAQADSSAAMACAVAGDMFGKRSTAMIVGGGEIDPLLRMAALP